MPQMISSNKYYFHICFKVATFFSNRTFTASTISKESILNLFAISIIGVLPSEYDNNIIIF